MRQVKRMAVGILGFAGIFSLVAVHQSTSVRVETVALLHETDKDIGYINTCVSPLDLSPREALESADDEVFFAGCGSLL